MAGLGDPEPLAREGSRPGLLAIHGFGGTPREVAALVDVASELGLAARAPLLPGHGTNLQDLVRTSWEDWLEATESELDASGKEPVVVAGLSLGAALALNLAARRPERVLGVIALANALWLTPTTDWALAWAERLRVPDVWVPKRTSDIADPVARATNLTYNAQSVHAAFHLRRGGQLTRSLLREVRCPTLVMHGVLDGVCPARNARRVHDAVSARFKKIVLLPRSRHIITRDVDRNRVREEVAAFLRDTITLPSA